MHFMGRYLYVKLYIYMYRYSLHVHWEADKTPMLAASEPGVGLTVQLPFLVDMISLDGFKIAMSNSSIADLSEEDKLPLMD